MNHPPWLQSNSLWFQKLLYQLYSYFQPWLWLFTFPCSFILVSCCMLFFIKGVTAKDESVHITRAVLSTSKADISSLLFQEFALIFFQYLLYYISYKKSSKQNIFLGFLQMVGPQTILFICGKLVVPLYNWQPIYLYQEALNWIIIPV